MKQTVFTASLVICSRLLWARYGESLIDDSAVEQCQSLLEKAATIFQKLDRGNNLISRCAKYVQSLSRVDLSQSMSRCMKLEVTRRIH